MLRRKEGGRGMPDSDGFEEEMDDEEEEGLGDELVMRNVPPPSTYCFAFSPRE